MSRARPTLGSGRDVIAGLSHATPGRSCRMQVMHARNATMEWTTKGWQSGARPGSDNASVAGHGRWCVPGIANLHSHAFQRAMAGLAERQTHPEDSFWTWRETMYRFAARFDPDTLYA